MAAITSMQNNKAGNRVGQAVDDGKLKLKGGKNEDGWDAESDTDSWADEYSDDEDDGVPGGGTPAQIAADEEDLFVAQQLAELRKEQDAKEALLLKQKQKPTKIGKSN